MYFHAAITSVRDEVAHLKREHCDARSHEEWVKQINEHFCRWSSFAGDTESKGNKELAVANATQLAAALLLWLTEAGETPYHRHEPGADTGA